MRVAIVGGGFAGLAAAQRAEAFTSDVRLYDRGSYSGQRRGAWGEMVWDYSRLPIERGVPGYVREVDQGIFVREDGRTLVDVPDGVVLNRGEIEKHWAGELETTEIIERTQISDEDFRKLARESDLLIDASGPYPVSGAVESLSYDVECPTLSGRITQDVTHLYPEPRALAYENYFLWIVPQSRDEATIGLGCRANRAPEQLYSDLVEMLASVDIDPPDLGDLYSGTFVSNGLGCLQDCAYDFRDCRVHIAGDAAGLGNRLTGFGMLHAAHSGQAAVTAFARDESYPEQLRSRLFWPKLANDVTSPIHDRIGLDGIARLSTSAIDYQETFEPERPWDVLRSVRSFV